MGCEIPRGEAGVANMRARSFLIISVLAFSVLLSTNIAFSKKPVGKSFIGSEEIVIFDNYTWEYVDKNISKSKCDVIGYGLKSCAKNYGFEHATGLNADATAQYRYDDKNYGMIISEDVGTSSGMTLDFMKTAVIENLATAINKSPEDIRRFDIYSSRIAEMESATIIYGSEVNGLDVVYYNTFIVEKDFSFQFISFSIGKTPDDDSKTIHEKLINSIVR